jgi:S-formylglutathione hydrolase FrmB
MLFAPILPASERISFHQVPSAALGRTLPVTVIAPEAVTTAAAAREVPVLFFLHGRGRHHRSLLEPPAEPATRAALLRAPFFIVLPQGEDGWYIDSPVQPEARYHAWLEEVVAWAGRSLPVSGAAAQRGIAGWSMGGYGAVRFAQTHPGAFGFVGSVIGLLDFPRPENLPEGRNYRVPTARFTGDPAVWATLNPLHAVETLRGARITLVLATRGFERTMNEHFLAALAAKQLTAEVHWLEGGHEFTLVERALPLIIDAATRSFQNRSQ